MSTQGLQKVLARIYTDAQTREAYLLGNEAPLSAYDLSAEDLDHLRELRESAAERLKFFSGLLTNKQGSLILTLLPLTFKALGESLWDRAWLAYISTFSTEAMMSPTAKAIAFLDFLDSYVEQMSPQNFLERDLILYERCKLSVGTAVQTGHSTQSADSSLTNNWYDLYPLVRQPCLVRPFHHDVTEIISFLNSSSSMRRPQPAPTLMLFYRHRQTGSVNTAKIAPWLKDLLNLCDGRTRVASIAEWLGKRLGINLEQLQPAGVQLLRHFDTEGVLSFISQSSSASVGGHQ
jgi:hypothetical protein